MKEYMISAPLCQGASRFIPAHLIYKIKDGRLLREQIPLSLHGGMMVVGRVDAPASDSAIPAIIRECVRFGFESVLAALPPSPDANWISFADELYHALMKKDIDLFLPLTYYGFCSVALVPGAVCEGKFNEYLEQLMSRHTDGKLALELSNEPLDFVMPYKAAMPLTSDKLHTLLEQTGAMTFYSADLCTNYFTYTEENTHLITFDTAQSLTAKRDIAQSLGMHACVYAISPKCSSLRAKLENKI